VPDLRYIVSWPYRGHHVVSRYIYVYIYSLFYSDWLRAGRYGDRIPVEARFSSPVRIGRGANLTSYKIGAGSFPGLKRPGRSVSLPPPPSAEVKDESHKGYLYSLSGSAWQAIGRDLHLPFSGISDGFSRSCGMYGEM
jgi:hypothetical protein